MKLDEQSSEAVLHEEGVNVKAWLRAVNDGGEGNFGPMLRWIFEDEAGEQFDTITGVKLTYHPKNKLGKMVKGITGETPATVDTDDIVGAPVNVTFQQEDIQLDDGTSLTVENILTVKGRKGARKEYQTDLEAPF